jgi:hypothetical protein
MSDGLVLVHTDLHEFFRDEVVQARRRLGVAIDEATEYYLVNLLSAFSRRDGIGQIDTDEPLVLLHRRALEADANERFAIYKQMGDWALYVAGFFAEFIERSLVSVDYYVSMGTAAYRSLAQLALTGAPRHALHQLYEDMARMFAKLVAVFGQVALQARERSGSAVDLLRLYNRFERTQEGRAKKMLEGRGVLAPGVRLPRELGEDGPGLQAKDRVDA